MPLKSPTSSIASNVFKEKFSYKNLIDMSSRSSSPTHGLSQSKLNGIEDRATEGYDKVDAFRQELDDVVTDLDKKLSKTI